MKSILKVVILNYSAFLLSVIGLFSTNVFAASVTQSGEVFFSVQVPDELKSFAKFQLSSSQINLASLPNSLEFILPSELAGVDIHFSMTRESNDSQRWTGKNVEARCGHSRGNLVCSMRFNNLKIENTKVEELINGIDGSTADKMNRIQVAQIFGVEQVGFLTIPLKVSVSKVVE